MVLLFCLVIVCCVYDFFIRLVEEVMEVWILGVVMIVMLVVGYLFIFCSRGCGLWVWVVDNN